MPNPMAKRKLRVFLDSNVIRSGLFSDRGAPRIILDILSLELPVLAAVTGAYNISEVERNLAGKLPAALPVFHSCLKTIGFEIVPLPATEDISLWRGATADKDLPVLASAVLGGADVLVTEDERHLLKIKKQPLPFRNLSPAEFLNRYLPEFLKARGI